MRRRLILQETWTDLLAKRFFISYFIEVYTFYFFLNWFSTRVSDDQKYVCGRRLYVCINTRKFKGLDSRKITSLPEIKKVIYMARHFQSSPKINRMLITRTISIQWKFTTPDHRSFAIKFGILFFFRPLSTVHLFQSNQRFQAIEIVDRHVSEKL